jgi:cyclic-di-AMP phosphodiesterase PgpH
MIAMRRRAGPIAGVLLGLAFTAVLVPVATCEHLLGLTRPLAPGDRAPLTIRVPDEGDLRDQALEGRVGAGRLIAVRGEVLDSDRAALVNELHVRGVEERGPALYLGPAVAFALIGLLLSAYMRSSHRGRVLRMQVTVLGMLLVFAAATKALLIFTPVSWFLVPTAAVALLAAALVDRYAGFGAAVALAVIVAALLRFDAQVAVVLGAQGLGAVLAFPRAKRSRTFVLAGLVGGLCAAAAHVASSYFYGSRLPDLAELADPWRSSLVASFLGGAQAGPMALLLRASVERLGGEIPRSKLVELADLENPLLKKIAAGAPGTWQHSLAMANLAEIAANAIGAHALLVRVGAYYHDLGKALQPEYYIENLAPGQKSPHDSLPPETSADAIFAHVTEGVRLARASGLPPAIIDFMHMHHGDGLLEYFWGKCQEQGNPQRLAESAFRYPGTKPQSRETAILAICDAVEAASRTLRKGDSRAIEQLVQRIVYGKLHLGQLDESGLTVAELKKLANTLVDTLKHANHGRIEYPWQKEEKKLAAASTPAVAVAVARSLETSGRFVLDSADAPGPASEPGNGAANATAAADPAETRVVPLVRRRPPSGEA